MHKPTISRPMSQAQAYLALQQYCLDSTCSLRAALVFGSPGSGKSFLCKRFADEHKYHLHVLNFRQLAHEQTTTVEQTILHTFRQQLLHPSSRILILIDDLDLWAPSELNSLFTLRIVAALNDALEDLREQNSKSIVFLATSCRLDAIHHSLLRPGRIAYTVGINALSFDERLELCVKWVSSLFPDHTEHQHFSTCIRDMAAATPGLTMAEMLKVISQLKRTYDSVLQQKSNIYQHISADPRNDIAEKKAAFRDFLASSTFWTILRNVTPTILYTNKALLFHHPHVSLANSVNEHFGALKLYGLDGPIQQLTECLTAIFAPCMAQNSHSKRALHALTKLGNFRGIIVHGPTGCGKSALLSLATRILPSGTINFLKADSTSIVSSVIGKSETKLSNIFSIARSIAPTLVIIENIDTMAPIRTAGQSGDGSSSSAAFNRLLSTLLIELDGALTSTDSAAPVIVLGTTRSLSLVDPALLRPGRIEIQIAVEAPSRNAREKLFQDCCEAEKFTPGTDVLHFMEQCEGWTALDIITFAKELAQSSAK